MRNLQENERVPGTAEPRVAIKDWPANERPREKLLRFGPQSLTDAELLAILIRVGWSKGNALDIARSILAQEGSLHEVAGKNAAELMRMRGIGEAKAVGLLAAFEIGRRSQAPDQQEKLIVHSPEDVARLMVPKLRDRLHEVFVVLVLDSKNGLKIEMEISRGTLNASIVHPREVFKAAIDHMAASIVVVHNHPSGNAEPSREDIEITRQLVEAGKIIGIPVHDHLIVAGSGYVSFAERGLL